jgi:hypothetical protein
MDYRRSELIRKVQWLTLLLIAKRLRADIKAGKIKFGDALCLLSEMGVGIDVSPEDIASDEYGCSESVTRLIGLLFPFKTETFTGYLEAKLLAAGWYNIKGDTPREGDIVLSPTPYVGSQNVGHVGIIGKNKTIYSNSSTSGTWQQNYTLDTWTKRYNQTKNLPIIYLRRAA